MLESFPARENDDRYAGVRILLMKVIIRAMFDYASYKDHPKLDKRKDAENARVWLFERSEHPNSFESICLALSLQPRKIRDRARTMTKEDVAKIEFKDRRPVLDEHLEQDFAEDV